MGTTKMGDCAAAHTDCLSAFSLCGHSTTLFLRPFKMGD
jgi:hypothetical protein